MKILGRVTLETKGVSPYPGLINPTDDSRAVFSGSQLVTFCHTIPQPDGPAVDARCDNQ